MTTEEIKKRYAFGLGKQAKESTLGGGGPQVVPDYPARGHFGDYKFTTTPRAHIQKALDDFGTGQNFADVERAVLKARSDAGGTVFGQLAADYGVVQDPARLDAPIVMAEGANRPKVKGGYHVGEDGVTISPGYWGDRETLLHELAHALGNPRKASAGGRGAPRGPDALRPGANPGRGADLLRARKAYSLRHGFDEGTGVPGELAATMSALKTSGRLMGVDWEADPSAKGHKASMTRLRDMLARRPRPGESADAHKARMALARSTGARGAWRTFYGRDPEAMDDAYMGEMWDEPLKAAWDFTLASNGGPGGVEKAAAGPRKWATDFIMGLRKGVNHAEPGPKPQVASKGPERYGFDLGKGQIKILGESGEAAAAAHPNLMNLDARLFDWTKKDWGLVLGTMGRMARHATSTTLRSPDGRLMLRAGVVYPSAAAASLPVMLASYVDAYSGQGNGSLAEMMAPEPAGEAAPYPDGPLAGSEPPTTREEQPARTGVAEQGISTKAADAALGSLSRPVLLGALAGLAAGGGLGYLTYGWQGAGMGAAGGAAIGAGTGYLMADKR
jgi:hypothetical protein